MNKDEFDALTQIDGVNGTWFNDELEYIWMPIHNFTPNFYKVMQDHFNLTLSSVAYNEEGEELQVWFEEE